MIESFIAWIRDVWDDIRPWVIVKEYAKGIKLRFGRFHSVLDPGLHWRIPHFDDIEQCVVVQTTMPLQPQSITTKDDHQVVAKGVVSYQINDAEKFYVRVTDAIGALQDIASGAIYEAISSRTWDEVRNDRLSEILTKEVREAGFKWGIEVNQVVITDLAQMKSYRLLGVDLKTKE
jgi:regulator of protease activity HflC (stomatin/prohibitin superfamily)